MCVCSLHAFRHLRPLSFLLFDFRSFFLAEGGIEIVFRNTRKCFLNFPHFPSFFFENEREREREWVALSVHQAGWPGNEKFLVST